MDNWTTSFFIDPGVPRLRSAFPPDQRFIFISEVDGRVKEIWFHLAEGLSPVTFTCR